MSLKAVHVCFILASIALAFGFGGWALKNYEATKHALNFWLGIGAFSGGVALAGYLVWFIYKMKKLGPS